MPDTDSLRPVATAARAGAAGFGVAAVLAAVLAAWLGWRTGDAGTWKSPVMTAVWVVPGVLVAAARPRLPLGWLALGEAVLFAAAGLADQWTRAVAAGAAPAAGVGWAIWLTDRFSALLAVGACLLLVLLPDGRLPSPRWRPAVGAVAAVQLALVLVFATASGTAAGPDSSVPTALRDVPNPAGLLPAGVGPAVEGLDVVRAPAAAALLPGRGRPAPRGATPDERARVVTVLLAATTMVLVVVLGHAAWPPAADVLDVLGSAVLATALTAAALGRRPRAVAALVRETLVVTVLAALIGALTALVAALSDDRLTAFATGTIVGALALAAHPWGPPAAIVDRLLRRDLADPTSRCGASPRARTATDLDGVLAGLAASAAASLRVPWAAAAAGRARAEVGAAHPTGSMTTRRW